MHIGIIFINNHFLHIFAIKYNNEVYWITSPHGHKLQKDKEYKMLYNGKSYSLKLHIQSYWCDISIFKMVDKQKIVIKNTKFIKSRRKLEENMRLIVKTRNKDIKASFKDNKYFVYLDIIGNSRTLYYEIETRLILEKGMSGSPVYNYKNELLGIVNFVNNKLTYCVPSFFILEMFDRKNDFIPYIPFKIDLLNKEDTSDNRKEIYDKISEKILSYIYLTEEYNGIPRNSIIINCDGKVINGDSVYVKEIAGWVPFDTYILIFKKKSDYINIEYFDIDNYKIGDTIEKKISTIDIEDLNSYLKYPFKTDYDNKTYQDLFENLPSPKACEKINNNLIIK